MNRNDFNPSAVPMVLLTAILFISGFVGNASETVYYVDSIAGSDGNTGLEGLPWQTLTKVNNYPFAAGDTILFKRGGVWTGGLIIQNSGTANAPITYSAYGDKDPNINNDPVFENPGNDYQNSVEVVNGVGYIVIENFMLRNAHQSGVIVRPTAHHVTVQDCEATKVGCGVYLVGHDNLVQRCYFHHLTMIVNSRRKGGDDYGALGVNVNNSNNEVRNCTFIDCNAPSYDYGTDGGAVEIYAWLTDSSNNNINVDNINIHHNYALRTNGFTEIGGDSKTPAYRVSNVKIYQNVWEDTTYDLSMMIHYGGSFGVDIENIQVNNNTIVQHNDGVRPIIWGLIGFTTGANPLPNDFSMRNNIIYSEWIQQIVRNGANIGSNHNIIFSTQSSTLGFTADISDDVWINPLLVRPGSWGAASRTTNDFRLQSGSPAINRGADLGYTVDMDGTSIPQPLGGVPDRGAYEYVFPEDNDPPVILGSGPTGDTRLDENGNVSLWVKTDEPAICEYKVGESGWTPFYPDENLIVYLYENSKALSGLSHGVTYTYYIRATDEAGHITSGNDIIEFTVDSVAPGITIMSPLYNQELPSNTPVEFHLQTDEKSTCEYWYGGNWIPLTTDISGIDHNAILTDLANGASYAINVRATDEAGNVSDNMNDVITFFLNPAPEIALVSPADYQVFPADITKEIDLCVSTLVQASCEYRSGGIWYPIGTSDGLSHCTTLQNLVNGTSYTYYVRAIDLENNISDELAMHFSIAQGADITPPVITIDTPSENEIFLAGTAVVSLQVRTDEAATCQYSLYPLTGFGLGQLFNTTGGENHTADVNVNDGAQYTYFIRGRDEAGNVNPADTVIHFSVAEPANIVAHYNMNQDFNNVAGTGNNGTPQNGAALVSGGVGLTGQADSKALSLDGSNKYVEIPDSGTLDLTDALTLEAWVNPSSITSYLINKTGAYSLSLSNYMPQFSLYIAGKWRTARSNVTLTAGLWYHVVGTYTTTDKTLRIYVNGAQGSSKLPAKLASYLVTTNDNPVLLGTDLTANLSGLLDEVRLFNRALTATEIQTRYNALKPQ